MDSSAATLVERIEALLPQTQCRRCGYAGCEPYARAVAKREAPINQCPPGGDDTVVALAALLGVPPCPVDCIAFTPADRAWTRADAELARDRFRVRSTRLERQSSPRTAAAASPIPPSEDALRERRQAAVSAALARARARRAVV